VTGHLDEEAGADGAEISGGSEVPAGSPAQPAGADVLALYTSVSALIFRRMLRRALASVPLRADF
jgi:hypothetical protein